MRRHTSLSSRSKSTGHLVFLVKLLRATIDRATAARLSAVTKAGGAAAAHFTVRPENTMATWGEFASLEPGMAELALRQLEPSSQLGICFLATVRKDGGPRLHPVGPFLIEGRLFLIVNPISPKRFDLARDRRYVLHTLPGPEDEEFRIEGRAARVLDNATRDRVAAVVGHHLHDADWLFELTIESALTTYWENWAQPDTRPIRRHWPARR